jgi:hypothetical protein
VGLRDARSVVGGIGPPLLVGFVGHDPALDRLLFLTRASASAGALFIPVGGVALTCSSRHRKSDRRPSYRIWSSQVAYLCQGAASNR